MSGGSEKLLEDSEQEEDITILVFVAANYMIRCIIMTFFPVRKQKTSINSLHSQRELHKCSPPAAGVHFISETAATV